ncbi:LysR family transcriptional regulator [Bartonella apis]|uniref:DNA-binding transcriptional regulator, LysR family n=1 Tax=Bartonella apis TaxID=1686310 RepID=A0A1R0FAY0_9HYPH|nr:LysR family transcriptional regulator [Bartonella apis]MCT6825105.1 LysR family transcriptional regulator [Bartonella apis]MCT6861052.1 LysR family transcriptional regulator [Bartonella apis]MCT6887007.1 LysR family transcriptional regulator [Bartonella apis]OLY44049.1 DNA-binding transcriptional regulator, LysR family [Bartonella apis]
MQIRTLEAFIEIIRQNGFSAAAKVLNATQSTISKSLAQLENQYGTKLINRNKGKMQLTAAGEYVFRHAQRILAEETAIEREIAELKGLKRGVLKIGLPPIGSSELFAPVLARYTSSHPQIDINIVEHGSKKLEELVRTGEIELAGSLVPIASGFDYQDVRNDPVVALMPASLAGDRKKITAKELAEYPFVLFASQFALTPLVMEAFHEKGLEPVVSARSSQIDFLFGLVAAGMGVGFLPRMIAEKRNVKNVKTVVITDTAIEWHMALIWRSNNHLSYAAREWLRLSRQYHGTP